MPERRARSQSFVRTPRLSLVRTSLARARFGGARLVRTPSFARRLVICCTIAWLAFSSVAIASEYHGQVTFGGVPVPGTTVTVTATQGSKKVVAVTDTQGVFTFPDLTDGAWTLNIEMTGFAPIQQDIAIAPNVAPATFEMKLLSLDQIRAAAKPVKIDVATPAVTASAPSAPGPAGAAPAAPAKGAAAKAPAAGQTTAAATPSAAAPAPAPATDANSDGFLINGSVNNAATSQYSLSQAFGNARNGRSLYNGGAYFRLDNSAIDAKQYSISGLNSPNPQHNNLTAGVTFGGPLKFPKLWRTGPNFFVRYERTQNSSYSIFPTLVPTAAEEAGNLSQQPNVTAIYVPSSGLSASCLASPGVVPGSAFPGDVIPAACISPIAQNYLNFNFYPSPNVAGNTAYNYQIPLPGSTHADAFQTQLSRPAGKKDYIFGGMNWTSSRSANTNIFNFNDETKSTNIGASVTLSHRFTQRLGANLSYNFTRSHNQSLPFFANRKDLSAAVGITDNERSAAYWGPPALNFSSGIGSLYDANSSNNRIETNVVSVGLNWNRLRHNIQAGADFRRQEWNYLSQQNPEGSFTFTGQATQSSAATGGSDFADFLLGLPDTSSIAFGNADKYLRESVYDAFILDDFRVNPELSVNAGVRWEYSAPVTENKNRLVNLDIAPGFGGETPVLGSSPTGTLSGQSYPNSLVRPDRIGIAPNVSIAWRPISGSSLLVRSSYQIAHDTSVYQASALAMAQQSPLSTSLSTSNSAACRFSLANAFTQQPCSKTTPDSFAVDPNFRVGYVQIWTLSAQRDLPASLQLLVTYTGNKGTHGVQEFLPNTYAPNSTSTTQAANPCPTGPCGFVYRTSGGDSTREAGSVQLRRRLRNGLTASALYTFSKSLDDNYSLGGQGSVTSGSGIAQDWLHLSAQRGRSNTDQRHLLNATLQYTTGMGLGGRTLLSGWRGAVYKEWTVLTTINVGSGLPETPIYPISVPGTSYSSIVRAHYTGQPIYSSTGPGVFLNPAAYAAPAPGSWGDAGRNSITGPNQFTLNGSMSRTFRLHDRYNLSAQIDANNVLNHVAYSSWVTTINSPQFGRAASAGNMRSLSITMRLRF
jgi:trimeric autotransporter adhesin